MQSLYQPFIDRVIHRYEGGYGWNQRDPGGPTNFGITCFDLAEHRHQTMTNMSAWVDRVKNMTLPEAEDIYSSKYAATIHFADLPAGVDCCMLDYGINSGDARPILVARRLVGVAGPNRMDQALLDAIKRRDPAQFINTMCDERLRFMHSIKGGSMWVEFGRGWQTRVDDLRAYCFHAAAGTIGAALPVPDLTKVTTPKATNVGKTLPKTTAGSAAGTAASVHLAGFHGGYVAAAAFACVIAGVLYEAYQAIKANKANALVHV
jgi:lysozyme family protein